MLGSRAQIFSVSTRSFNVIFSLYNLMTVTLLILTEITDPYWLYWKLLQMAKNYSSEINWALNKNFSLKTAFFVIMTHCILILTRKCIIKCRKSSDIERWHQSKFHHRQYSLSILWKVCGVKSPKRNANILKYFVILGTKLLYSIELPNLFAEQVTLYGAM